MIKAEGDVEGRVAEPGAFGVEEDRPVRPDQDVLRADVAVDQRPFGRQRGRRDRFNPGGQRRMRTGGRAQIGLDADRLESPVMGEGCPRPGLGRAPRMDEGEVAPDRGGEIPVDPAREKLGLPQREAFGRQVVHGEQAGVGILGEHMRDGVRQPARDRAQIGRLRRVALDRRLPQRRDLEPRERPLDAEAPAAGLDEADVGRDAAGQRRDAESFSGPHEAEAAQGLLELPALRG